MFGFSGSFRMCSDRFPVKKYRIIKIKIPTIETLNQMRTYDEWEDKFFDILNWWIQESRLIKRKTKRSIKKKKKGKKEVLTSNFLHRWIFIGFSSSSSSALHRVLSRSNSRCMLYTSRRSSSTLDTLFVRMCFSRRNFLISNFKRRMSSIRCRYWISPEKRKKHFITVFN